jgi:Na+/H+ antiporter NhaD/arsenite permease-like protein
MYPLEAYPKDAPFWHMIAYAAGTGGSMLIVGSAAGVALMGIEKIDFIAYLRRITLPAAVGFLAGMGAYLLLRSLHF